MDIIFIGLAKVVDALLEGYLIVVIVAVLVSWVNPDPYNPIVRILHALTVPVFKQVQVWMPFLNRGGIDFSPVAVLLAIGFLQQVVPQLLYRFAMAVR